MTISADPRLFVLDSFLGEHSEDDFPREYGRWIDFDCWSQQWSKETLRKVREAGIIDVDFENQRYRLTMKATQRMAVNDE
jgi:hypothetical protein